MKRVTQEIIEDFKDLSVRCADGSGAGAGAGGWKTPPLRELFTSYLGKKEYWTHELSFLSCNVPEDLVLLWVVA